MTSEETPIIPLDVLVIGAGEWVTRMPACGVSAARRGGRTDLQPPPQES
jgi:hypothetical protein